jgi:hypothetical protein
LNEGPFGPSNEKKTKRPNGIFQNKRQKKRKREVAHRRAPLMRKEKRQNASFQD